jgi:transcriptional regulator with XRE-family HTH domain
MARRRDGTDAPSRVFGRQVKEARRRLDRMTQAELGVRLRELGVSGMRQETVARLEKGTRRVTLDDALAVAVALGIQPVWLLSGYMTDEPVRVVPALDEPLSSREAWEWIRGGRPLGDPDVYFGVVPDEQRLVQQWRGIQNLDACLADLKDALRAYVRAEDGLAKNVAAGAIGDAISDMTRELERQEDELRRDQRRAGITSRTGEEED